MNIEHYKAAAERTDADERALIPAFKRTNKAQPQHSPLPWHVCTLGEKTPHTSNISDVGGSLVARVESYPYRTTGKADAALIVRAVNHCGKLAEACRAYVRARNDGGIMQIIQNLDRLTLFVNKSR